MTNSQKIDFLYSKFVYPNRSQTSVFNSQVWRQGDEIPSTLPEFNVNGEYVGSSGKIVLKKYENVQLTQMAGNVNAFSSAEVFDIVSYENGFDVSYEYSFYSRSSNGVYTKIPFGESGYFFDHDTGILFFPNGSLSIYNRNGIFVSFIKYVGEKGINPSSQFPGSPQLGPTGPTGPTGETGGTGTSDPLSIRYKGQWSSSYSYSRWDLVKYDGKFFISTIDQNTQPPPTNYSLPPLFWQPFGIPQLSDEFDYPGESYFVSPGFAPGGSLFDDLEPVLEDIKLQSFTDVTVFVYPGNYQINNNIVMDPLVNINFIFYGRVNVSFSDDSLSLTFSPGSKIEFRGNDFQFTNGKLRLVSSNLAVAGAKLNNIEMITTYSLDTARLIATNSELVSLKNYASFVDLRGTNVKGKIEVDDLSVTHITGSMIEPGENVEEKIKIIHSAVPTGLGFDKPALLIKNSRVLSNSSPVLYSDSVTDPDNGFEIGLISSSLYVNDSSIDFLDFSRTFDAFILDTVVNTTYDETKLNILNIDGSFQVIQANFED